MLTAEGDIQRFFTTREVGELYDQPEWLVRRIVDELDEPVDRFGLKRMIPAAFLPQIGDALRARGRLTQKRKRVTA